ncbi:golgin subfamily A member 6-like protein 6 [Macrobrachium rosenbergii]|uniref:golgin subfamily A member 6-like protein 6 n=1 Tax=Macrobrachium rosenbergii TaxID=79674 RepID=UPI0034D52CDF
MLLNHVFSSVFDALWTSLVAGGPGYGSDFDLKTLYDDCVYEPNFWPSPMVIAIAVTGLVVGFCLAWFGCRRRNRQGQRIMELDKDLDMDMDKKEENEETQLSLKQQGQPECENEKSEDMENSRLANILQLHEKLLAEKQQLEAELSRASSQGNKTERLLEAAKDEVLILENKIVAMESDHEQRLHQKGDENAKLREDLQRALDQESKTNLLLQEAKAQNEALQHHLEEKDALIKQKEEETERKSQALKDFDEWNAREEERLNSHRELMEKEAARKEEEVNKLLNEVIQKEEKFNLYMENARRDMEEKEKILVQRGKELDQKYSKLQQMKKGMKNEEWVPEESETKVGETFGKHSEEGQISTCWGRR